MHALKQFKSVRKYSCLEAFFGILIFRCLLDYILYPTNILGQLALLTTVSLLELFAVKRSLKLKKASLNKNIETATLDRLFDHYSKRTTNWILLAFLGVCNLAMTAISMGINSKLSELSANFYQSLFLLEVLAFFLIKNILILKWLTSKHNFSHYPKLQKTIKQIIITSTIFWIVALVIHYIFEYIFASNIYSFITGICLASIVLFNFTTIKKFTYNISIINKIAFATTLTITILAGGYILLSRDIWLTQPYINSIPNIYEGKSEISYDEANGVYTIVKPDGDFKILQLTDIHLGGSILSYDKDLEALKAIYKLLDETRPDLVVVTGDMVFPVGYASFSLNNSAPVQQFAAFMRNTGIPWAFTFGNHDTEKLALLTEGDLNDLYMSLSWKTSKTLLYPYTQPEITGRNNQLIELRNQDGSLNQALFLIDSNAYTGEGLNKYDYIHDDQVDWYKERALSLEAEEGHKIPSMIFFHIPLQEYEEAYNLYESGSNQVTYYFGSNEEKGEDKICNSDYPSKLFDTAVELGSTTNMFFGHDHYNNMSLEYKGIRMTYGMSIDYLAMPGIARENKQRGATLITVNNDGETELKQVPLGE